MSDTGWGIVVVVVLIWQLFRTWQLKTAAGIGAAHAAADRGPAAPAAGALTIGEERIGGTVVGRDETEGGR